MAVRKPVTLIGLGKGLRFTESPRWHNNRLWFIDIHDSAVKSVSLNGDLQTEISLPFKPNGLGFLEDGSVIFSDALHLQMKRWDGSVLHDYADISTTSVFCLSDAITASDGMTYVGDIGYNFWLPDAEPVESCVITRIDPCGIVTKVADGLSFPNGMVITPDGKTLIVAETNGYRLTAFDIAANRSLSNRRIWAQLPEDVQPDGICIDAEGAVWVANPAGSPSILRVREGGEVIETILLDTHAYAAMLGGPERRHLFICTSASHDPAEIAASPSAQLLVVEVDVSGVDAP
jgi:sugar lactone lactonase YvrE